MGNCSCRLSPASNWADDDERHWADEESTAGALKSERKGRNSKKEKTPPTPPPCPPAAANKEVRVRINRKQLEDLLGRAKLKGLPAHDIMADIICVGRVDFDQEFIRQQHWRPALYSIAEESDRSL